MNRRAESREHADPSASGQMRIAEPSGWVRLIAGLALVFGLLLGSDRGQAGLAVGTIVVAATLLVEQWLFGRRPLPLRELGLGRPYATGLLVACVTGLLLLSTVPIYSAITGARFSFIERWYVLIPGLFAQAGVAEEVLFRGYLFGQLRHGRSFWRAAALSMLPFVAVHMLLFMTMPWPIALASVLLAAVISVPLAHLFELGGFTMWAPALVHFVIQGTVKILVGTEDADLRFPIVWMAASGSISWLTLFVPRKRAPEFVVHFPVARR